MSVGTANFILASALLLLVVLISWSHWREHRFRHPAWLLGATVLTLATLGEFSALPGSGFWPADWMTEPIRTVAAFLRGIALALVAGYAWHRWVKHDTGP